MSKKFIRADSSNLPRVDAMMVAGFFARNPDFCSAEFKNVKTVVSSRETYGDDAIGYVQLCRENDLCFVKCKMCPEQEIHDKQYNVTLTINEKEAHVVNVMCHDCVASQGGCKHSVAFLMWVHRRSEEPSCASVQCYWEKPRLAQVGGTVKFVTVKELSQSKSIVYDDADVKDVFKLFVAESKRRRIRDCQLLKYQPEYENEMETVETLSLHYLSVKYNKELDCVKFLSLIASKFSKENVKLVEMETRAQHESRLWYELRYGRITASEAYEVCQCKTPDGSLVEIIMGARTPETSAMKRGHILKDKVRKVVADHLGEEINKCGLMISHEFPMLASSPDGLFGDKIIEIICPTSQESYKKYLKNGKIAPKAMCQMQIQMCTTSTKNGYLCVADPKFEENNKVTIIEVAYNDDYVKNTIHKIEYFWKTYIYHLLYRSTAIK